MRTEIYLRRVNDDGVIGETIGTAIVSDRGVTFDGSEVLDGVVTAIMQRFRFTERDAVLRLAADGWSNGKMVITANAG